MKRRELIRLLGGAAAWPLAARALPGERMRRIGVLMPIADDAEGQERIKPFQLTLHDLGWVEGRNIQIDYRWTEGDANRIPRYVSELVMLRPDVIFETSSTVLAALKRATNTIPIVFVNVSDPVGQGFVASLARPGGNITGFMTTFDADACRRGDRVPRSFTGQETEYSGGSTSHDKALLVLLEARKGLKLALHGPQEVAPKVLAEL